MLSDQSEREQQPDDARVDETFLRPSATRSGENDQPQNSAAKKSHREQKDRPEKRAIAQSRRVIHRFAAGFGPGESAAPEDRARQQRQRRAAMSFSTRALEHARR